MNYEKINHWGRSLLAENQPIGTVFKRKKEDSISTLLFLNMYSEAI